MQTLRIVESELQIPTTVMTCCPIIQVYEYSQVIEKKRTNIKQTIMEIEFEITKTDYEIFYKQHFINELRKKITAAILIPLIIGYSYAGQPFYWMKFILGTIITGFLYLAIFYLIPYFVSIYKLRKAILEEPGYLEKKKISIIDEELYFENKTSNITRKWESLVSVDSNEKFVSLRLADKRAYLIPKTAFISENEATEFLGIV